MSNIGIIAGSHSPDVEVLLQQYYKISETIHCNERKYKGLSTFNLEEIKFDDTPQFVYEWEDVVEVDGYKFNHIGNGLYMIEEFTELEDFIRDKVELCARYPKLQFFGYGGKEASYTDDKYFSKLSKKIVLCFMASRRYTNFQKIRNNLDFYLKKVLDRSKLTDKMLEMIDNILGPEEDIHYGSDKFCKLSYREPYDRKTGKDIKYSGEVSDFDVSYKYDTVDDGNYLNFGGKVARRIKKNIFKYNDGLLSNNDVLYRNCFIREELNYFYKPCVSYYTEYAPFECDILCSTVSTGGSISIITSMYIHYVFIGEYDEELFHYLKDKEDLEHKHLIVKPDDVKEEKSLFDFSSLVVFPMEDETEEEKEERLQYEEELEKKRLQQEEEWKRKWLQYEEEKRKRRQVIVEFTNSLEEQNNITRIFEDIPHIADWEIRYRTLFDLDKDHVMKAYTQSCFLENGDIVFLYENEEEGVCLKKLLVGYLSYLLICCTYEKEDGKKIEHRHTLIDLNKGVGEDIISKDNLYARECFKRNLTYKNIK